VQIEQLVPAESGWKAVFREADGGESQSRILGWAVAAGVDEHELVGVIVDPSDPSRIVPASEAVSPEGGEFARYRFVAPEPIVLQPPPPPPPPAKEEEPAGTAEQVAKSLLKRKR
jgi:hypothetical protein